MEAVRTDDYMFLLHPLLHSGKSMTSIEGAERFVAFFLENFQTIVIVSSLIWMFARAYQVLSKPSQDLIDLLGIEVPTAPTLSLHGIKADGVVLNWKAPDIQKSSGIKCNLYLNGINIAELSASESSFAITDLAPETNYIIRIIAANPLNFEARSEPIHVQTRPAVSQDFFRKRDSHDQPSESTELIPVVRPYKLLSDAATSTSPAPAMQRDHSGSISQQRKTSVRRVSSAAQSPQPANDANESDKTIRELTAKLDRLNQECEAAEEDMRKEDVEFHAQQTGLNASRTELKQAVTDKEGASKALKKQVADFSSQNSSSQARRQVAEKRLQSKHDERQKLTDDVHRWEQEIFSLRAEAEALCVQKSESRTAIDEELERMRQQYEDMMAANKTLEDTLRQARGEIKELEHEKTRLGQEEADEVEGPSAYRQGSANDWNMKLQSLSVSYQEAYNRLEQAKVFAHQATMQTHEWEVRRANQPHMFLAPPQLEMAPGILARRNSNRQSRTLSLRNEHSPLGPAFDLSAPPSYSAAMASVSPAYTSGSLFFNVMNGAPIGPDHAAGMSQQEIDQLTGGAPTSPSVTGALLPSGLLGDDEPSRLGSLDATSSHSSPMASNALPGLGAPQTLEHIHRDPTSPISNTSRSPSVFASPRESSTHLPFNFASDSMFDSDRRSIRSNTSSMRNIASVTNPGTRFANLFGFNRQRGKPSSEDGPALGSLKSSESHSFPRQDLADLGSSAARRRGSHSGGAWHQLTSPFSRIASKDGATKDTASDAPATRRRFGVFGSKIGDAPESPRPGSTASAENPTLPRPGAEGASRFGWGNDSFGSRQSPLGADWGLAAPNSWSRHPSRRPSVQYGPGQSFAEELFAEQEQQDPIGAPRRRSPKLAPIGTRPTSQISASSAEKPKLNPAAPSFKIPIFNREKKAESSEKKDKAKSKKESTPKGSSDTPSILEPNSPYPPSSQDFSPPDRFSKDFAPSISTADTASEPRTSLERTPSRASEAQGTGRETFMQKLSRKSSASMFTFPGFTRASDKRKGATPTSAGPSYNVNSPSGDLVSTPDGEEEDQLSKSYQSGDSKTGALAGLGLGGGKDAKEALKKEEKFSFRRSLTGRRKGDKAPSIQESETGDEIGAGNGDEE